MNSIAYIAGALILAGGAVLAFSLMSASRLVNELPRGGVRRWWNVLRALIVLFLAGYGVAALLLPRDAGAAHLVMSAVFLFGALFVLLASRLMLTTVLDVRRIATLEVENVTDPLLGIFNRRYMEQRLKEEVARANRYDLPLSLCIMDIDHFKRVNDAHGHPAGDEVLRALCQIIRNEVREVDLFARYGGEEFVVVLPNTAAPEARVLADRLRRAVERTTMTIESGRRLEVACTISIGLATAATRERDGEELLRRADRALYQAKASGRNRVEVSREDVHAA